MIFHVLTIFPEFFEGPFEHGVIKRARDTGALEIRIHNLRDWTFDRHKTVDDRPFGGGEGMLLKPEPLFSGGGIDLAGAAGLTRKVVLLSAQGRLFDQKMANEFSGLAELLLICGRYEGVDERVAEHLADDELSIGELRAERRRTGGGGGDRRGGAPAAGSAGQRIVGRVRVLSGRRAWRGRCSIARNTRGRRSFADGKCRKFC